ncbi:MULTISPECIES: tyrosine-type recombinase/integrase [Bifidobacterium]|jgi:integrase|uniref:Tyrosine-type recombinase/integrase n=3 Tax=Bifidobacterium crudilactis TaxID=327277 RepID=A0A971ID93_9BIFI|nr:MULTISPECIES: tyrosine-type recombinase/integrase [Bifidobacterium]MCI1217151.1 tyrosine-type recombinase/integrase [Bifidobacterium crudilactis]MCI1636468.1 tyrosine-type recombinase/integrase [Bifidobacterium sp.]MCI1642941.1 tyrosine-type recombinase/integrase [Bifidobacterium crudilactis]MCI1868985.1 tyrosine-type recombinase/integrase [Bifidobacterium crudilactis]MCI1889076.1 tyrosine-type recombinase/integrase [Bifidobacterium crudilactis]
MTRRFGTLRHKSNRTSAWIEASYLTPFWAFDKWPGLRERQYASFDIEDEAGALVWLRDAKLRIDAHSWQPEREILREQQRRSLTFAQYFEQWLGLRRTRSGDQLQAGTVYRIRKDATNHILPFFGKRRLAEITSRDVDRWWDGLDHSQRSMCINALKVLKSVLASASSPGPDGESPLIPRNPCTIMTPSQRRNTETVPATIAQVRMIYEAMPERYRAAVYIAVFCNGPRIGEICALTRSSIDLDHMVLHIRTSRKTIGPELIGSTKTEHSERDESIPPQLKPMMETLVDLTGPEAGAFIFPGVTDSSAPLHPNTLRGWYDKARIQAGRKDLRFHDLRHTALTLLAQQGATVREIMDAAGHSDPQTAMRYQHSVQSRSRYLARQVGSLIPGDDTVESLRSRIEDNDQRIQELRKQNEQLSSQLSTAMMRHETGKQAKKQG